MDTTIKLIQLIMDVLCIKCGRVRKGNTDTMICDKCSKGV